MSPVNIGKVLFWQELGITFQVSVCLFLIESIVNNNEGLISQLFPVTFSQSFCSQFLMMLKPSYQTPARMKVKGELCIYGKSRSLPRPTLAFQVGGHPSL